MASGVLVGRGYVSIRPEFEGDWSRSVNARASSAGRSGGGVFSKAFGAAISGGLRGIMGGFGTTLAAGIVPAGAAVAALAPALATAGTAAASLKLGLSGVGGAFKAAFADGSAQASSAASATKAVEAAQRGLANAQRGLADARVQAAKRVREAVEQVDDAERDLADAQREARSVQGELNDARREAARALQDMNQQLAEGRLDERDAVLRLKEAERELKAAQAQPGTDPADLERLQIAYERARLNLQEQRRDTKRLAVDTAAANKAGVEGSEQVVDAKERIADANRNVADKERALADAQASVVEAQQDGARQVADAQRAVADAAAAVADAQSAAAAQTSQFDQAMAKLAPNARSFVTAVQGLGPAWTAMRLSVQNELFKDLDGTVTALGRTTIPILQRQLTATAGVWNQMAKSAADAITEMARSGMLEQILKGSTDNLRAFADTPRQLLTAFGQLAVAAQPAFNGLMQGFAGAIASGTSSLDKAFASGALKETLDTAFSILGQLAGIVGDAFGAVGNILNAASDAGANALAVVGSLFEELRRITAMPEIQSALRTVFASIAQIAAAIAPVFGAVLQAVMPLLAAIAPLVAQLAQALGPALAALATALGNTLMPIIEALAPAIVIIGDALGRMVTALAPVLVAIGEAIGLALSALLPIFTPLVELITQVVEALAGPLAAVFEALTPYYELLTQLFTEVFGAITPLLGPIADLLGTVAGLLVGVFAQAIQIVMEALSPLVPVIGDLISSLIDALMPILPTLAEAFTAIADAALQLLVPLGGVISQLVLQLAPILTDLAPILGEVAGLLAGALVEAMPPLTEALLALLDAFTPLFPLIADVAGMVLEMGAGILMELLPPMLQLIQAGIDLALALLPIVPPLAELVGLVVELALNVLSWLLPPLLSLVDLLVGGFADAIGTAVGIIAGLVTAFAGLVTWIRTKVGPVFTWLRDNVVRPVFNTISGIIRGAWDVIRGIFNAIRNFITGPLAGVFRWIRDNVVRPVWNTIRTIISNVWNHGIKPVFNTLKEAVRAVGTAFDRAKDAIKKAWDKLVDIAKKPVEFVVNTVYNNGIRKVWNLVAGAFGAPKLDAVKFARGGIMPGYTPGRDPHKFYSPTGGALELSGGEAIMRPEFTRAVGAGFVGSMNQLARSGGSRRVREALAPILGGNPRTPTDRSLRYANGGVVQSFADGGIFGWIKSAGAAVAGAGSAAWNKVKQAASWLKDTMEASARAGVENVVDPLLKRFPGMDTGFGKMLRNIPTRIIDALFGYTKEADKRGAGGVGGPKIQKALNWAKTQHGKPYQWGGNGNPSWDCSGLQSAIESVIRGQKPHRRWATMAFRGKTAPPGWVRNGKSAFQIGITNAGVGHTAGTLGKTNVESRGGDGVVVGKKARGAQNMMFTDVYGFMPGKYDTGGWLGPGQLGVNQLRQPEAVLTPNQWRSISAAAANSGAHGGEFTGNLFLDSGEFLGVVRGELRERDRLLIEAVSARRY